MNNTIHIEIQIVELFIVGVWSSSVNWDSYSIDLSGVFFDDRGDNLGIFLAQPAEQCCRSWKSITVIQRMVGDHLPGTPILEMLEICVGDVSYSVVVKNLGGEVVCCLACCREK